MPGGRRYLEALSVGDIADLSTLTSGPQGAQIDNALLVAAFGGGVEAVAADVNLGSTQLCAHIDATAAPRAANLPPSADTPVGRTYIVVKTDASANAVSVVPDGADPIAVAVSLTTQFEGAILTWNGTNWMPTSIGSAGAAQDLATTLTIGNITGGTDIEVTDGDAVRGEDAAGGSGLDGTDLLLRWGLGDGAGNDGAIKVDSGGNARGTRAIDLQKRRGAANQVASGFEAVILGGYNNRIEGTLYANLAFGGRNQILNQNAGIPWHLGNVAFGFNNIFDVGVGGTGNMFFGSQNRFYMYTGGGYFYNNLVAGYNHRNTTPANYVSMYSNAILGSNFQMIDGTFKGGISAGDATVIFDGFHSNNAVFGLVQELGPYSTGGLLVWGQQNDIATTGALTTSMMGGLQIKAEAPGGADLAHVMAWGELTHATITGELVWANESSARQGSIAQIQAVTTNVTTTDLTSRVSAGTLNNRYTVRSGQAQQFEGVVIAHEPATGDCRSWYIEGLLKNIAGTTSLVGSTVTARHNDAGAAAWTVALAPDDPNDSLAVQVTGENGKTIQWNCMIWAPHAGTAT